MKKIFLSILLVGVAWVTAFMTANAETYGDLTYRISNNYVIITDCDASATEVVIPETIEGLPVTNIYIYAFEGCSSLTSITIPETVTRIGPEAFKGCSSLESIVIPSKVTLIDSRAFQDCSRLTSITIPDSAITIGDYAFVGTQYYENGMNWENGVLYIGNHLIEAKDTLTAYTVKSGTKSIADMAFSKCSNLASITIPDSVECIGYHAFYGTAYYKNEANWEDGVLYINNHLIEAKKAVTSCVVRTGTKSIANYAFWQNTNLVSVTMLEDMRNIGFLAFGECSNLLKVVLGTGVQSIGSRAFERCNSLAHILIPESIEKIDLGAFFGSTCKIFFEGSYEEWMTFNCSSENLKVYFNCISCTDVYGTWFCSDETIVLYEGTASSITVPASISGRRITKIGKDVFDGCKSLITLTLPDSITSIESGAFNDCTSLANITIPDGVTSIGADAFTGTAYYNDATNWKNGILFIDNHLIQAKDTITTCTIPNGVLHIADRAFINCKNLISITIPNSISSVGADAFYGCSGLVSIAIPGSVTYIGGNALNASKLIFYSGTETQWEEAVGGRTVTTGRVFCAGTYKTEVTDNGIWYYADTEIILYEGEASAVAIPAELGEKKIKTIGEYAFYGNTTIESVTIPEGIQTIPSTAFGLCDNLQDVYIQDAQELVQYNYGTCFADAEVHFSYVSYAVTYDYTTNGGTSSAVSSVRLREDRNAVDLTPTAIKTGWEFVGWNTNRNATEGLTALTVEEDTVLYAIYKRTIPVAFYAGENILISNAPQTVYNLGSEIVFPGITEMSGKTALGWRTDTAADAPMYTGTSISLTDGATFYAVYSGEITLTYDANGGEDNPESQTEMQYYNAYGTKQEITFSLASAISRTDFLFAHWGKNSADGEACTPDTMITITEDTTMYAVWRDIPVSGITLNKATLYTKENAREMLMAQISPANAANRKIIWTSSDTSVARVENDGVVTIIGRGTAVITATTVDGEYTATCNLIAFSFEGDFVDYGVDANGIYWALSGDGVFEMVGQGSAADYEKISDVPWYIGRDSIKNIVIDDRIIHIGARSFYGFSDVEKAEIPKSVTSIGTYAFGNCTKLTIYGEAGTSAETYADENSIPFVDTSQIPKLPAIKTVVISENENWYFNVSLKNHTEDSTIYVVVYNENGKLLHVETGVWEVDNLISLSIEKNEEASHAAVFAWEKDGFKPVVATAQRIKL